MSRPRRLSIDFRTGLAARLADVEHFAKGEVERVMQDNAQLRAENEELKRQLAAAISTTPQGQDLDLVEESKIGLALQPAGDKVRPDPDSGLRGAAEASREESPARGHTARRFSTRGGQSLSQLFLTLPGDDCPRRPSKMRNVPVSKERSGASSHSLAVSGIKTTLVQHIVRSNCFENVTSIFIILNALWIGIDLDTNGKPLLESPPLYQVIEHVFVTIFTAELVLRCLSFDNWRQAIADRWFMIDALLVPCMIIDSWVFSIIILATGDLTLQGVGVLSVIRMMRLTRIVRIARVCRVIPELETMVASMMAGVRAVLITSTILLFMTYAFAIVMRQLTSSAEFGGFITGLSGQQLFETVPRSMYTLVVQSMLPDQNEVLDRIFQKDRYAGMLYFTFLLFSAIMVVNMLIALLCDVVSKQSREEQTQRSIDVMSKKLQDILMSVDDDYDGVVSRVEFEKILDNAEAVRLLHDVGVDVDALVDEADFIFGVRHNKNLSFEDFKEEVLLFRQTSVATMGTIAATRRMIRLSLEQIAAKIVKLETAIYNPAQQKRQQQWALQQGQTEQQQPDFSEQQRFAEQSLPSGPNCTHLSGVLFGVSKLFHGNSRQRGPVELLS